jgi:hypothetical protein
MNSRQGLNLEIIVYDDKIMIMTTLQKKYVF